MSLNESHVEDAALAWFGELGYAVGHGPELAPGEVSSERDSFGDVVLVGRLQEAIRRLNPAIPAEAREEALRKVLRVGTASLVQTNRAFHRLLRDGVPVEYPRADGSIADDHVRLVDFVHPSANGWVMVEETGRASALAHVREINELAGFDFAHDLLDQELNTQKIAAEAKSHIHSLAAQRSD